MTPYDRFYMRPTRRRQYRPVSYPSRRVNLWERTSARSKTEEDVVEVRRAKYRENGAFRARLFDLTPKLDLGRNELYSLMKEAGMSLSIPHLMREDLLEDNFDDIEEECISVVLLIEAECDDLEVDDLQCEIEFEVNAMLALERITANDNIVVSEEPSHISPAFNILEYPDPFDVQPQPQQSLCRTEDPYHSFDLSEFCQDEKYPRFFTANLTETLSGKHINQLSVILGSDFRLFIKKRDRLDFIFPKFATKFATPAEFKFKFPARVTNQNTQYHKLYLAEPWMNDFLAAENIPTLSQQQAPQQHSNPLAASPVGLNGNCLAPIGWNASDDNLTTLGNKLK
ncbi:hypothetical protein HDU79_003776 [Rhizoclosmatium sp. JEL0117]|nr:hypothetical protein HDU79_003776 [Rhizoclosmatium sp. JEL0117]